ncbi:MAG: DUF2236 domain-containing protein [Deltaproteobacteria bacterium]|nr:DUF2236 domain-containing protein [Deltaproteobacteria bacterium]
MGGAPSLITAEERARFDACCDHLRLTAAGPNEGLFGPRSTIWRALREVAVPLVGMRAVILQLAHPALAAAGRAYSNAQADLLGRTRRTFAWVYGLIYGDLDTALGASRRLHQIHGHIHGVIPAEISARHAGRHYRALDPELLFWVLATMIDSTPLAYQLFLQPMGEIERELFYREMKRVGVALGIPILWMPATWSDFERYFASMIEGTELEASAGAQELLGWLVKEPLMHHTGVDAIAAGILPPRWRREFGLSWSMVDRLRFEAMVRSMRMALQLLPPALRYVPAYHHAMLRAQRSGEVQATPGAWAVAQLDRIVDLPFSLPRAPRLVDRHSATPTA